MAPKVTPKKKVALKKPVIRPSSQAAANKPIISLGTLITVVIFAAIILSAIYINQKKESDLAAATPMAGEEIIYLFSEKDGVLSSIQIAPATGSATKLARDEKNVWAFELPAKAEADQGLVEAAAGQVSALQIIDTLPKDADPVTFGLDAPVYIIKIKFDKGKTHMLSVGDSTPTNSGYYVRAEDGKIMIVDLSGIDALTQLAIYPPYLSTATPEVTPTP